MMKRSIHITHSAILAGKADGIRALLRSLLTSPVVEGKEGWLNGLCVGLCINAAIKIDAKSVVEEHKVPPICYSVGSSISPLTEFLCAC